MIPRPPVTGKAERGDERATVPIRAALVSIAGFWLFYFAIVTLRALLLSFSDQGEMLWRRAVVTVIGAALTVVLYLALRPAARASVGKRIAAAALLSVPAAIAFASFNYVAFYVYEPLEATKMLLKRTADGKTVVVDGPEAKDSHGVSVSDPPLTMIADSALTWYFFFGAWAALHIALGYAAQAGADERRAARFRAAAREAEIRALRYQVNPHFLFNTLNALSSLVLGGRAEEAERMIMNLATFFRTSLAADPVEDVTLAEEIRLQRLYLDIEAVRFPDRLTVTVAVPTELEDACVPNLILQPLIENAIKHGVARSGQAVTITIGAAAEGDRLALSVTDNASPRLASSSGVANHGLGLRNVRDRLVARFGDGVSVDWGAQPDGGFAVRLVMPLVRHGC